jgi:hypothetical protein
MYKRTVNREIKVSKITRNQISKLRQYCIGLKDKSTKKRLENNKIDREEASKLIALFSKML